MSTAEKQLSKEAARQLVRYLYLLIDIIEFSQGYPAEDNSEEDQAGQSDKDFDDPMPF